ncbi:MAG: hypothetical protein ACOYEV_09155 [Candidatus Nanopelagicales bacterium]
MLLGALVDAGADLSLPARGPSKRS